MASPTDVPADYAWANPSFQLGNTKTWSTIHQIYPGVYWWAYYLHETIHCLEWMLEKRCYPQLRNPDDAWWNASCSHLTSSTVAPPPANLGDEGEYLGYAMNQRIKGYWFVLPPTWGEIRSDVITDGSIGNILMYSCPDAHTLVEASWRTKYARI